jgi:spermidine/putrescine transport system substrate-binding protein
MARESFESAVDRLLSEERISRRGFVGRAGSAALATSLLGAFISACGGAEGQGGGQSGGKAEAAVNHPKTALTEVIFSNWPLYIDKSVIKDFNKKFAPAKLKYTEDINDNTEFFGKVRQPLQQGDSIGRDLVALTDWMAARWIRLGYTEGIDYDNVPNGSANLVDSLRNPPWDKGRKHSLPWQSGQTGIGYNRKLAGELKSFKQLFDPKFKGKVTLLSEARDTLGNVMWMQGKNPADATMDDIMAAIDFVDGEVKKGQIRKFTGNEYSTDLAKGNIVCCEAWSGDMVQLQSDNPDLRFAVPEEGGMLWSDNMMIPQKAPHPYGAEVAMNFFYDPEVAAKITQYVNYVSPVKGVKEILLKKDPGIANNHLIFPDEETVKRLALFPDLSVEDEQKMNEAFEAVIGA